MARIGFLAALWLPVAALADQEPNLYGRLNLSLEHQAQGTSEAWALESNASRLGLEGEFDLDPNTMQAVYRAEFGVAVDDGGEEGQVLSARDLYAGFEHGRFGRLIAGQFDTPLKVAQGDVDLFNNLRGDIGLLLGGENRPANVIQYASPTLAEGFTIKLAFVAAEQTGGHNDSDGVSSTVEFKNERFRGALAYDRRISSSLMGVGEVGAEILRAVAEVSIGNLEFGALAQRAEAASGEQPAENTSWLLSAALDLGRSTLKAQYGATDVLGPDRTLLALGADYALAEKSRVFIYGARKPAGKTDTGEDTILGLGFEHRFSLAL